jgi:hypothetical protein
MSAALPQPGVAEVFDVAAAIAPALTPLPMAPERRLQLKRGVLERVSRSARAHRDLTTVRREDGAWQACGPGVLQRALSAAGGMRVDLLKVAPHTAVVWPKDGLAQEVLVVEGDLDVRADASPTLRLGPLQQWVTGRAAAARHTAGPAGATLYVRSLTVGLEALPANEARWWATAPSATAAAAGPACGWARFLEGVDAAVLHADGDVASMLIKIAPGATLPDHGHGLDEDCFMLEGDMFLGDVLMRAGDYQWAHIGGQHVGISSDTGGLFYFHGAVPASEPAP